MVHRLVVRPYCQGEQVVKRGKTDTGKQRYRCQNEGGTQFCGIIGSEAIGRREDLWKRLPSAGGLRPLRPSDIEDDPHGSYGFMGRWVPR